MVKSEDLFCYMLRPFPDMPYSQFTPYFKGNNIVTYLLSVSAFSRGSRGRLCCINNIYSMESFEY